MCCFISLVNHDLVVVLGPALLPTLLLLPALWLLSLSVMSFGIWSLQPSPYICNLPTFPESFSLSLSHNTVVFVCLLCVHRPRNLTKTKLVHSWTFLYFQAGRSSATRSSASDLTLLVCAVEPWGETEKMCILQRELAAQRPFLYAQYSVNFYLKRFRRGKNFFQNIRQRREYGKFK